MNSFCYVFLADLLFSVFLAVFEGPGAPPCSWFVPVDLFYAIFGWVFVSVGFEHFFEISIFWLFKRGAGIEITS